MSGQYTIRQVDTTKPEIIKTLKGLHKHCLPADEYPDFSTGYWWVVYDRNGSPVAFAGLVPSARWIDCGYFSRCGVVSYHRGKGLQRRLIRARIAKGKQVGYEYIFSDTHDNVPSVNNLIECGFRLYDPVTPYGEDKTLYWRLKLQWHQMRSTAKSITKPIKKK